MRQYYLACFALLALLGMACAFDASLYLYDGETASMVSNETFSYSGTAYTLVKINGAYAFLLSNDKPVDDAATIAAAMQGRATATLMPTDAEWAQLNKDFASFNASRNYKTRFGQAESQCMQATFLNFYPCDTQTSCYQTANQVCAVAGSGGSSGCTPDVLAQPIFDYSTAVKALDTNMNELVKTQSVAASSPSGAITRALTLVANLKTAAKSISGNVLRFPESNDTCPEGGRQGCIGICPSPKLDVASLDDAKTLLTKLQARVSQLGSTNAQASLIAQATHDREAYKTNSALALQWQPKWDAFKKNNTALRANASALAPYVGDSAFVSAYNSFSTNWASMDSKLASRAMDGVDNVYSSVVSSASQLSTLIKGADKAYNATSAAENTASDLLTQARWKADTTSKQSLDAYNSLANRKKALDAQFKPPLASSKYDSLTAAYANLSTDEIAYINSQTKVTDTVADFGGRFGAASINGVFSLTAAAVPLSYTTRASVAPFIPPAVLLLSDLAIVSIAVVMFVGVLLYFRQLFKSRLLLGVWILGLFAFLFAVGAGSIAVFAFVNSSSGAGNFNDFQSALAGAKGSYVAIDTTGAQPVTYAAMISCANLISNQTKMLFGKPTSVFAYIGNSCTPLSGNNTTAVQKDSCFDKAAGMPLFVMHAANTSKDPKFSTVYSTQAETYGDAAYYNRCEIGDVLG